MIEYEIYGDKECEICGDKECEIWHDRIAIYDDEEDDNTLRG